MVKGVRQANTELFQSCNSKENRVNRTQLKYMAKETRQSNAEKVRFCGWVMSVPRQMADHASFTWNRNVQLVSCASVTLGDVYVTISLQSASLFS